MESNFKSFRMSICAYKHDTSVNDDDKPKELGDLKDKIIELDKQIKHKEKLIDKVTADNSNLTQKLVKENSDIKNLVNEIKTSWG